MCRLYGNLNVTNNDRPNKISLLSFTTLTLMCTYIRTLLCIRTGFFEIRNIQSTNVLSAREQHLISQVTTNHLSVLKLRLRECLIFDICLVFLSNVAIYITIMLFKLFLLTFLICRVCATCGYEVITRLCLTF